ncbi:MAG: metallophosphoesterase [Bryobacteraceae bacterium]|nr:metallophosphoesterase [Bryobacteraceae bacterium]
MPLRSRRDFLGTTLASAIAAFAAGTPTRPYLQNVTGTSATLVWSSPGVAGPVEFGPEAGPFTMIAPQASFFPAAATGLPQGIYLHQVELTGLSPRTTYRYRVAGSFLPAKFRTPGSGHSRILAFGDSGAETDEQRQLAARMTAREPDLILHTGDLVYPAGDADTYLRKYFGLYQDLFATAPAFPCPGNHDYYADQGHMFVEFNRVPRESVPEEGYGRYYSFDWENAHIAVIDSNAPLEEAAAGRGPMLDWLDRDLATSQAYWRIVMFHHPPYAGGPNQDDPLCALVRRHVVPILERHQVDLVLSGHEHNYQRTYPLNGIVYLTTGGGGASIYPTMPRQEARVQRARHHFLEAQLEPTALTVQAIGLDGQAFDTLRLAPKPRLSGPAASAAYPAAGMAPGGLATVMGRSLAPSEVRGESGSGANSGVRVLVNGLPAAVLYANANQVNFRVPAVALGPGMLRIETANGAVDLACDIAPTAPALFPGLFDDAGRQVTTESPAAAGSRLTAFFTGLGQGSSISGQVGGAEVAVDVLPVAAQPGLHRVSFTAQAAGEFLLFVDGRASNAIPVSVAR